MVTYDNFFKDVMKDFLGDGCDVEQEVVVGKLPLRVDLVVRCIDPTAITSKMPVIGALLSRVNIFEYKSSHDKPHPGDLPKLLGYAGLYCAGAGAGIDALAGFAAWYVTARTPRFIKQLVNSGHVAPTPVPGIYEVQAPVPCPCRVMVINELSIEPGNLPFLLLGSGDAIRSTIKLIAGRSSLQGPLVLKYLRVACDHNYTDVRGMTELNELIPGWKKKNIRLLVEDLGMKVVIEDFGLKAVIDDYGVKAVIDEIGVKAVIDEIGVDAVVDVIDPDILAEAMRRRGRGGQ